MDKGKVKVRQLTLASAFSKERGIDSVRVRLMCFQMQATAAAAAINAHTKGSSFLSAGNSPVLRRTTSAMG